MKDFELTLRLRNNQLKSRRLALGLTHAQFAELACVSKQAYMQLETMSRSPISGGGTWRKLPRLLAQFYKVSVEELFPDSVLSVTKPVVVRELDTSEIVDLLCLEAPEDPELLVERKEELEYLQEAICKLRKNQQVVMQMRMAGDTLEEIGRSLGRNRETVRQIENSAIRQIRDNYDQYHPLDKMELSSEQMRVLNLLPDHPRAVYVDDENVLRTIYSLPRSLIAIVHKGPHTGYSRSSLGGIIASRTYPYVSRAKTMP